MPTHSSTVPSNKVKTTVYWDKTLLERLKRIAHAEDRSFNLQVAHVLRLYADRWEREHRDEDGYAGGEE